MQPAQALEELTDISTELEAAVLLDGDGAVLATTLDDERSREIGRLAHELLATAQGVRRRPEPSVSQLEVAMRAGSVFVACGGGRTIVATTAGEPTSGLVLYDLKTCLRTLEQPVTSDAA